MSDETDAPDDALFDVEPEWRKHWQDMPEYEQKNLEPHQSVLVHFASAEDRRKFATLVGQRIEAKTKFIWYPEAKIRRAADKVYTSPKVTPRYPVYIISKGRADSRLTSRALEWRQVPYHIVIEPQEYEQYAAVIDPQKILVLPFSNLGLGGIPARNWVWEHAVASGAARHWILDDNIDGFCRFQDNLKVEIDSGLPFVVVEDFVDRYENIVMAGFNYDYFAPRKQGSKIRPITFNTRIYSGILLSNKISYRWRGRYNEDTDLSLRILKDGWCTALFNAFLMYKKPTLTMKGGNTDELYKGVEAVAAEWEEHAKICETCGRCLDGYGVKGPCDDGRTILEKDGRWRMAESLREQHPDCTTVERKWRRWQHQVDYRAFEERLGRNVLKLKEGAPIVTTDYAMELAPMPEDAIGYPTTPVTRQRSSPPRPVSSGPSILDFLSRVATTAEPAPAPVAAVLGPPEPELEKPPEPESKPALELPGQPSELPAGPPDPPVLSEPVGANLTPAEQFACDLLLRGHRILTRDGRLFFSDASRLTPDDDEKIKRYRSELLALAEPWPQTPTPEPAPTPEPDPVPEPSPLPETTSSLFAEPAQHQSLAVFLGAEPMPLADANWRPDEPPSLDGIDDVVVNLATTGLEWAKGHRPVGVTVSTMDGGLTRFLPFAFQGGGNIDENVVKRWAERELRGKKITNAKTRFDIHHFREWGVDLEEQGCTFSDIQHTAALLDDHRKRFAIDILGEDYLPDLPKTARIDESRHSDYHASEAAERERFTAELVWRLRDIMYPQIEAQELRKVHDLEDAVIPCVVEMEKNGSPLDLELLDQLNAQAKREHDRLMREVSDEAGFGFEHTAKGWQRLFEHCGVPPSDSYAEDVVGMIEHPLIKKAHLAAQHASLNSKTFAAYKKLVDENGLLRYDINQLHGDDGGTVSGRFSIGYVHQVPNHDNHHEVFGIGPADDCDKNTCPLFPKRIFIAGIGDYFESDAMQIEQRLFAHFANNLTVIEEYKKDPLRSFHKITWEMIKRYKPDMLYVDQKRFNFARQYGAKMLKLAVTLGFITTREAEEIKRAKRWDDPRLKTIKEIEAAYNKMLPEGDALLDYASHLAKPECDDYCKRNDELHRRYPHRGYVKTLLGRRSRFPDSYKTYIGLNRVLQGTGADIMKQKIVELHRERKTTGFVMRLTVHDAATGSALNPETRALVGEILNRQSFDLRVPILWSTGIGQNWAACK